MTTAPNIALIVLDTLRKDRFESEFEWLHSQGIYFENGWSTSHWTVPAHASLFSGKYAREIGTGAKNRYLNVDKTLADRLSDCGYRTTAITANASLDPQFNYDSGFNSYLSLFSREWSQYVPEHGNAALRYLGFLARALRSPAPVSTLRSAYNQKIAHDDVMKANGGELIQKQLSKPQESNDFLFLNLMEAHSPYHVPQEYRSAPPASLTATQALLTGGPQDDPDVITTAYNDSAKYLSDVYKNIFAQLRQDYDLIITVSDHGEALGESDYWGHPPVLTPEITSVPIHIYGAHENGVESTPVNLLDVYQTVCDAAEIPAGSETRGTSLLTELDEQRSLLVESNGMTERAIEIAEGLDIDEGQVQRLDEERYGVVTNTGFAYQTLDGGLSIIGEVDNPEGLIENHLDGLSEPESETKVETSQELIDQLQDLGYA